MAKWRLKIMQTETHKVRMTVDALHILELVAQENELAMGVRFGAEGCGR